MQDANRDGTDRDRTDRDGTSAGRTTRTRMDELTLSAATAAVPVYGELAKIVLGAQPLGAVLTEVSQLAKRAVPGADEVSVTLLDLDRPRSVAFSGPLAAALDERQYEAMFGPCMDAAISGDTVEIRNTADESVYPEFAYQAARAGIRHTLSIGLIAVSPGTVGALNLYGAGEPFDDEARDIALTFASYAAVAVLNAAIFTGAVMEAEQLREAMASRAVIEQAKGIIMGSRRCTASEAFDILRDDSMRGNRKLRDIAQRIVDEVST